MSLKSRDWRLFIDDMLTCCRKVQQYTDGLTYREFLADDRTYDATVRNLEIIGEAATHIPEAIRRQAPHVEWRGIVSLRNALIHGYGAIDNRILWDIIQTDVPELEQALNAFLHSDPNR